MSVDKAEINNRQRRAGRVKSLKKIIVILLVTAIVIPTVLCIILLFKVHSLEEQMQNLYTEASSREQIQEQRKDTEKKVLNKQPELMKSVEPENTEEDTQRKVYLTFDDGPSANTAEILDILKKYNVKATFFVVGKTDEAAKANYQRIVTEGHTLGMHSYSHKYNEIYASAEAYKEDLNKLQTYLYELTGVQSKYVRFPGGSSNRVSKVDMQDLIAYLQENDITYYDWNIASGDADNVHLSAKAITDNCLDKLEQYNREAMILMHDANDKQTTVEALPDIIEQIQQMENTVLLPITEDTVPIQHVKAKEN